MGISRYDKVVLVTGTHRSGSTWLGNMLSLGQDTAYLHEPFNIGIEPIQKLGSPIRNTFEYLRSDTDMDYQNEVKKFLDLADFKLTKRSRKDVENQTLILKDPIAFMSAEWIAQSFNSQNVMLIRHPAAFVASLKVKSWHFDFKNFINQPDLMEHVLFPFADEIRFQASHPQDIVNQGILLWNIFYYRTKVYQLQHPEWIYVKHEDLSKDPIPELKKLYERLGLPFDSDIESQILKAVQPKVKTEFKRDSKENIYTWKERLTEQEIARIREGTSNISDLFYSDAEWDGSGSKQDLLPEAFRKYKEGELGLKFHMDAIKPAQKASACQLSEDSTFSINGWAFSEVTDTSLFDEIHMMIGGKTFKVSSRVGRADVAAHFKSPHLKQCGFAIELPANQIPSGSFTPSLVFVKGGHYEIKELNFKLKVLS